MDSDLRLDTSKITDKSIKPLVELFNVSEFAYEQDRTYCMSLDFKAKQQDAKLYEHEIVNLSRCLFLGLRINVIELSEYIDNCIKLQLAFDTLSKFQLIRFIDLYVNQKYPLYSVPMDLKKVILTEFNTISIPYVFTDDFIDYFLNKKQDKKNTDCMVNFKKIRSLLFQCNKYE